LMPKVISWKRLLRWGRFWFERPLHYGQLGLSETGLMTPCSPVQYETFSESGALAAA
jgi:hypothetical protein